MAEKRMFSKSIIDSDDFIDMPMSARLLYYDLAMRADDDGFITPRKVVRMTGASNDDLKILALKKFIIPFESGVVVIKHWRIHNYIRKDTYHETTYKDQKSSLFLDENNAYTTHRPPVLCEHSEDPSQDRGRAVDEPSTQYRLDKNRLDESILDIDIPAKCDVCDGEEIAKNEPEALPVDFFAMFWAEYPRKKDKANALKAFKKLKCDSVLIEKIISAVRSDKLSKAWKKDGGQYIPYPSTWLNGRRWEDEHDTPLRNYQNAGGKEDLPF